MSETIQKECDRCGDIFEPIGYEGCRNQYCGRCERDLPDGHIASDEYGNPLQWSAANESWTSYEPSTKCDLCNTHDPEPVEVTESWEFRSGIPISVCSECREAIRSHESPYIYSTCDICSEITLDETRMALENWEFCEGLQKQFCGRCREEREEPACDTPTCDADVCYNHRNQEEEI